MNIIFISIAYPKTSEESNLYSDLMEEFAKNGHNVYVVCSIEKRFNKNTHLIAQDRINVLRVRTGDITSNPNYIEKGLALLKLQDQIINGIKGFFSEISFELILYSTPPIQYNKIIKYLKKYNKNAKTFLLLKDIFPQNAVDMGLISKYNPIYYYFKKKERETYILSDRIGCMSPANVSYLLKNNPKLNEIKVNVAPNCLKNSGPIDSIEKQSVRIKMRGSLQISHSDFLLIYGGNLGISQGLSFLIKILFEYRNNTGVKFLIVGEGTEYNNLENKINHNNIENAILLKKVEPSVFKEMLLASDLGLIFLDPKFTIPNFPSRLTSYLEVGLPVIACTDEVTDVGDELENNRCGFKVISGDINSFKENLKEFINNKQLQTDFQTNARLLFENKYTTEVTYNSIIKHD